MISRSRGCAITSKKTGSVSRKLNLSLRDTAWPPFAADGRFADIVESNGCCESIVSITLFMCATVEGSKKSFNTITAAGSTELSCSHGTIGCFRLDRHTDGQLGFYRLQSEEAFHRPCMQPGEAM